MQSAATHPADAGASDATQTQAARPAAAQAGGAQTGCGAEASARRHSWSDARDAAYAAGLADAPDAEWVPLGAAFGRVLAVDVRALVAVPHFASSAMDGWAVSGAAPWRLMQNRPSSLAAGEATEVVTGGLIPAGADAVLRSENGDIVLDEATDAGPVLRPSAWAAPGEPRAGQHIRTMGVEASAGELLIAAGTRLNPVHLAVAAGAAHDALPVVPRPTVGLVLTGDEVVTEGIPVPGRVRDSFGPSLPGILVALGATVRSMTRAADSAHSTAAALDVPCPADRLGSASAVLRSEAEPGHAEASGPADRVERADRVDRADVIITTGGTGHSPADHLRDVLRDAGAVFLVDGIDMRPGGPTLLARLPDGRHVVGLPGNPLAAMLGLLTVAHPLLAALQGLPLPPLGRVQLASAIAPVRAGTVLRPYRLVASGAMTDVAPGPLSEDTPVPVPTPTPETATPTGPEVGSATGTTAEPTPWHGAAMLRGLADADGVIVAPRLGLSAGSSAPCLPLPW